MFGLNDLFEFIKLGLQLIRDLSLGSKLLIELFAFEFVVVLTFEGVSVVFNLVVLMLELVVLASKCINLGMNLFE
jgi:hypothetical protein